MQWENATIRVPAKPLLKIADVAAIVDVHAKTIRRWVKEGRFPPPRPIAGRSEPRWTSMSVGVWLAWQEYVSLSPDSDPSGIDPETTQDDPADGKKKKNS